MTEIAMKSIATAANPLMGDHDCISISAWIKPSATAPNDATSRRSLVDATSNLSSGNLVDGSYALSYQPGPGALVSFGRDGGSPTSPMAVPALPQTTVVSDSWTWLALNVRRNGDETNALFYVNEAPGEAVTPLADSYSLSTVDSLRIGYQLNGIMDELRMSTTCRTDLWMQAEYMSMQSPLPVFSPVQARP